MSLNERIAAAITRVVSSMGFLYGLLGFTALWMLGAPRAGIDHGPWFPVLLYWFNLFQAVMLPVLAVGQGVLDREQQAQQDRIETLTRSVAQMLKNQQDQMQAVLLLLRRDVEVSTELAERLLDGGEADGADGEAGGARA